MHLQIPTQSARTVRDDKPLKLLIWGLSIFTMVMTIPQILTIWLDHRAAGVSALSWSAYLASAFVWFWYGLRKRDIHIYLPCVGWILMDSAVVVGVLVYG
jgi:uncharacterized protein with PQ loop repeat